MVKKYYRYSEVMSKLRNLKEDVGEEKKPLDEVIKELEQLLNSKGVKADIDPRVDRADIITIEYGGYVFECKPKV